MLLNCQDFSELLVDIAVKFEEIFGYSSSNCTKTMGNCNIHYDGIAIFQKRISMSSSCNASAKGGVKLRVIGWLIN